MDPVELYHSRLRDIWQRFAGQAAALPGMDRVPYYGQRPKGSSDASLLFLGVNPSYREDVLEQHWAQCFAAAGPAFDPLRLQWDSRLNTTQWATLEQQLVALDTYSRANYRTYYGLSESIAQSLGAENCWHALDVFPLRVTVQAQLAQSVPLKDPLPAAAQALLDAFVALLQAQQPRLVLVINAYASRLLRQHLPLQRTGTGSRYACDRLPGTTFLLSSMLTGAGALDEFSRERLVAEARTVWCKDA